MEFNWRVFCQVVNIDKVVIDGKKNIKDLDDAFRL